MPLFIVTAWEAVRRFINPQVVIAIAVALVAVALIAGGFLWRDAIRKERDAWWRAEIAKNSVEVRKRMQGVADEAHLTDTELIAALGETDAKLFVAERKLAAPPVAASGSLCPRIPAGCLGVR